jgi:trehalose/maltose hydrolase-like predicted phosphorylase
MESWSLSYDEWDESEELLRESLCTLGNGYFAVRGAGEESHASSSHYPGTYLAGGYNRLETKINDLTIENEDLVNWPNWICLTFRHEHDDWFDLSQVELLSFKQELDIQGGELKRIIHFKDKRGNESILRTRRIVSMDNPHIGAIKWELNAVNWAGKIEIKSFIDGSVINSGTKRYRQLTSKNLEPKRQRRIGLDSVLLEMSTSNSEIDMAQVMRTQVFLKNAPANCEFYFWENGSQIGHNISINCVDNSVLEIEKVVCLFTSKDKAIFNPSYEAERLILRCQRYDQLLEDHHVKWKRIWDLCDIKLEGNPRETKLLRLHIFHLLQTVSLNSMDMDVGVPSRGLHGEAYRGHIFWDEIYILPFLNLRIPEITRSLLMYRYRRLNEARLNAKSEGYQGAMYPWQSGSNGEEESQTLHLNPESGHWVPDNTFKQRHINATIVYNVWKYYQATNDEEFLSFFGVEMALEISRFWVSIMTFNSSRGRYDIKGVVGPDEFHTKYPGREELGIDNNAYTNFMASWCLRISLDMLESIEIERKKEILNILKLSDEDLELWSGMSKKIYLPVLDNGIISQFEGFEELLDLDWAEYRKKYGNIQRIDRILEAEGDSSNRYKLNKQADMLMLFYLFSPKELAAGFEWLNYPFEFSAIQKNIEYHLSLSTNGSSLSRIVHSWVLSRYDIENSWLWFQKALESDVNDVQGGTTAEGIHLGAMAGTVDLVQRCFTGFEVENNVLWIHPHMPKEIQRLEFSIRYKGESLFFKFTPENFYVRVQSGCVSNIKIGFEGRIHRMHQGEEHHFPSH